MKKALQKRGFTLVEIIVAVAIVALLATVILFAIQGGKEKSRDTQRVSDLEQVQLALRIYRDAESADYPVTGGPDRIGDGEGIEESIVDFLSGSIVDPRDGDDFGYYYDDSIECDGDPHIVLHAELEREDAGNWSDMCGASDAPGTNTYVIILR